MNTIYRMTPKDIEAQKTRARLSDGGLAVPTWAAPEWQERLADRARHDAWLVGAGHPICLLFCHAVGRHRGHHDRFIDPYAPLVGIPAAAFL